MKLQNKILVSVFFVSISLNLFAEGSGPLSHNISLIYGVYGFREVNDVYIYNGVESPGVFGIRYSLQLDKKMMLGAEIAYDNAKPVLKGNKVADSLYINTIFLTGRLSYTLYHTERFRLYVSGAFGLKQIDKNVIGSKNKYTELAKEFTLIGMEYQLLNHALIWVEHTNGDIALLKFGLSYTFY